MLLSYECFLARFARLINRIVKLSFYVTRAISQYNLTYVSNTLPELLFEGTVRVYSAIKLLLPRIEKKLRFSDWFIDLDSQPARPCLISHIVTRWYKYCFVCLLSDRFHRDRERTGEFIEPPSRLKTFRETGHVANDSSADIFRSQPILPGERPSRKISGKPSRTSWRAEQSAEGTYQR